MWDPYAEFQSATLPNGLTVHAAHWPGRPWEAMGFLVHSGAAQDPPGLEGLAHFVEHLVSLNAGISKKDMRGFFERCGGEVTLGSTDYSGTRYNFFVPAQEAILSGAFSFFGKMLLLAKLENFIDSEREIIIAEFFRNYPNKIKFDLERKEHKNLYAGHWLERYARPLGEPESIRRVTQRDLQLYYDAHYTPANISIVGVGGLSFPELVKIVSKSLFAADKKGARTELPNQIIDSALPEEIKCVVKLAEQLKTESPFEICSYRSAAKIPGNIPRMAIAVLSEMLNKVLDEEVRERRAWTYSIGCCLCDFGCFYQLSINCNALLLKALDGIEEVVGTCISSLGNSKDLLEKSKDYFLAKHSMIDPNGRGVCNGTLDDLVHYQRIVPIAECDKGIARVTMDDIRDLLQWLKPERRWTLIMKP